MERGTVVLVDLDPTVGHEQRGFRPCVVVSDPRVNAGQRYPLIALVPVTRSTGIGALYPALSPGRSGLRQRSFALSDQVRSVDKRRVRRSYGRLPGSTRTSPTVGTWGMMGPYLQRGTPANLTEGGSCWTSAVVEASRTGSLRS